MAGPDITSPRILHTIGQLVDACTL